MTPNTEARYRANSETIAKQGFGNVPKTRYCPCCGKQRTAATQFSSDGAKVCKRCAG